MKLKLALATLALLACAAAVRADAPLANGDRFSAGAGASYNWYRGGDPKPTFADELGANAYGAYALTQHFSTVLAMQYGGSNGMLRWSPGVHYRLSPLGETFAAGLTYDWYAGDFEPAWPHEWVVSAIYSHPLGEYMSLGIVEAWGFDNHTARTSVQVTAKLFAGKEK